MEVSHNEETVVDVVPKGSARTKANRKSKKFKRYNKEDLQKALMKIRNNEISYGVASRIYKVPQVTLRNKMQNQFVMPRSATTTKSLENEMAGPSTLMSSVGSNSKNSLNPPEPLEQQPNNVINAVDLLPDIPNWRGRKAHINRVSTMDIENNGIPDQVMNNSINFGILPNDTSAHLTPFSLSRPDNRNENKFAKLVAKIRLDVKELGDLCAPNENEKLNVVMAINHQLNLFNFAEVQLNSDSNGNVTEHRMSKSILKQPMPQRVKPKRNLRVSFAVENGNELMNEVQEREVEPNEDEIAKNVRVSKMKEVCEDLTETRKILIVLRKENFSKIKKTSQKRKSKIHADDANDGVCLQEVKKQIKEKNDQLRELQKSLKKDHVAANKAVAINRRNVLMRKAKHKD